MMFDIAIVGNGASAIASLKAVLAEARRKGLLIKVCVIGPSFNMGYGLAYNEDNDCTLMNTPALNISIDPEDSLHFLKWAKKNNFSVLSSDNVPRYKYGQYLYDVAIELKNKGEAVFFDAYALEIKKMKDKYEIFLTQQKIISAKRIILCSGSDLQNDYYNLTGTSNYLSNPYPLRQKIAPLLGHKELHIIGSGLTAVDICVFLEKNKYMGKIVLYSREGRLPLVKGRIASYKPKWCLFEVFLNKQRMQNSPLTLRQILREVRKELKITGGNWKDIFFSKENDNSDVFAKKIENAKNGIPWMDVLIAVQHEIDKTWAYVDKYQKSIFMDKYLSKILRVIASIPLKNANIISKLFMSGRLEVIQGVRSVQEVNDGYNICIDGGQQKKAEHIINACGYDHHVSLKENGLIGNLIRSQLVKPHSNGGICVCPITGRVDSERGIFAVGRLTSGEHPLINNIEFIVMNAESTAESIIKDVAGKNKNNNCSHFLEGKNEIRRVVCA